jgi:hypothetical protein
MPALPMKGLVIFSTVPNRLASRARHLGLRVAVFVRTIHQLSRQILVCGCDIGISRHGLDGT